MGQILHGMSPAMSNEDAVAYRPKRLARALGMVSESRSRKALSALHSNDVRRMATMALGAEPVVDRSVQ